MKAFSKVMLCAAGFAIALGGACVRAGEGHDHGPKHGGIVREVKKVSYELVAKPDSLTLYVSEHGKPISTQGAEADATLHSGHEKITVALEPAGENLMSSKGNFRVGVGVRAVVNVTLQGQAQSKVSFKLK